jgi:2Fe-2S ferredoxin
MLEEKNNTAKITFNYIHLGQKVTIEAPYGTSILSAAKQNNIAIKGSCKGKLKCATCHLYIEDKEKLNNMPKATEAELVTLNRAQDRQDYSRLCCQLIIDKDNCDGIELAVPKSTYFV